VLSGDPVLSGLIVSRNCCDPLYRLDVHDSDLMWQCGDAGGSVIHGHTPGTAPMIAVEAWCQRVQRRVCQRVGGDARASPSSCRCVIVRGPGSCVCVCVRVCVAALPLLRMQGRKKYAGTMTVQKASNEANFDFYAVYFSEFNTATANIPYAKQPVFTTTSDAVVAKSGADVSVRVGVWCRGCPRRSACARECRRLSRVFRMRTGDVDVQYAIATRVVETDGFTVYNYAVGGDAPTVSCCPLALEICGVGVCACCSQFVAFVCAGGHNGRAGSVGGSGRPQLCEHRPRGLRVPDV
jgi:hypothetical protein